MKSKGYADEQIEAQLASNPDPLQAAKAVFKDVGEIEHLKLTTAAERSEGASSKTGNLSPEAIANAKDLIASLKATGVVASDPQTNAKPDHGVATAIAQAETGTRSV